MKFVYSVIRFVPNPILGEFVNVGIIAGNDKTSDWTVRWLDNMARAKALAKTLAPNTFLFLKSYVSELDELVELSAKSPTELVPVGARLRIDETWLAEMHASRDNVIQFTRPLPVLEETSRAAAEIVRDALLFEPERQARSHSRRHLITSVETSFQKSFGTAIDDNRVALHRNVTVQSNGFTDRSALAVLSTERLQLTSVWSFAIATSQHARLLEGIRSFLWFVEHSHNEPLAVLDSREHRLSDGQVASHVAAVVQPPAITDERDAYEEAIGSIDASVDVKRFEPATVNALASEVASLVV